jgi:UDP-N-acetylglucosamine:LPS N-acetylglucosamine transferase
MRLLLSCTELGLGHVSRLIPLGKKLAARGHELHFFSGGAAYQLLKKDFPQVYPCRPVAWYESAHGVLASASFLNILLPLPRYNYENQRLELKSPSASETIDRYYDLRRHIRRIKPDAIVADGDMHALRLAKKWKIKAIYVTNIIRPSYSFSPLLTPGERFTERYVKRCERIIVPDIPKYTICEYNLGNLDDMGIRDKVEFVGSFTEMPPKKEKAEERHVFAPISGPLGTRAKLLKTIIPKLSQNSTKWIISLGQPGDKTHIKIGDSELHSWLTKEERNQMMKNAKAVVFSGSHGTCFEALRYMKPSVCIPTQPEQKANARKLEELGCSKCIKNGAQLETVLKEIEAQRESFKKNLAKISEHSSKFNGLDNAVKVIESLA